MHRLPASDIVIDCLLISNWLAEVITLYVSKIVNVNNGIGLKHYSLDISQAEQQKKF